MPYSREVSPISNSTSTNLPFSTYSLEGSFLEKEAFNSIKEVSFLSYYKDFKLLLYSKCSIGIEYLESHLRSKHFLEKEKKEKKEIIDKVLSISSTLEIVPLVDSFSLILDFSKSFFLPPFKELPILSLYKCSLEECSTIKASKSNIIRYLKEEYLERRREEDLSSYYTIIRG